MFGLLVVACILLTVALVTVVTMLFGAWKTIGELNDLNEEIVEEIAIQNFEASEAEFQNNPYISKSEASEAEVSRNPYISKSF
jgi:hypothetical protein